MNEYSSKNTLVEVNFIIQKHIGYMDDLEITLILMGLQFLMIKLIGILHRKNS